MDRDRVHDRLTAYAERRDFSKTEEPRGRRNGKGKGKPVYIIQKHDARRLHYDFRLEHDGVLLSWAVTRGPSTDPSEKRLAVRTEDHPLDYAEFEGTIPKGQYGGGTVMLWDSGRWQPHGDIEEGLDRGKLSFDLFGERLTGAWALVRMRGRGNEKRENWLLVKERDEAAREGRDPGERFKRSVKTGRSMDEIARCTAAKPVRSTRPATASGNRKKASRSRGNASSLPRFVKPALATPVDAPPQGDAWLHEVKWDGYRAIAAVSDGKVRMYSRSGADWTDRFANLPGDLAALIKGTALIDGEVVAAQSKGSGDFARLQAALKDGGPLTYQAFDLLREGRDDLRKRPLRERKERLQKLIGDGNDGVRYCDHITGDGDTVHGEACRIGLEGIVSKRADAAYRSDRHRDWLKSKCGHREEFVIGGYRPSKAAGRPFSSLLLGSFEDGRLVYRGRVGTGFDSDTLAELDSAMQKLGRKTSPFDDVPRDIARDAAWITPRLVAQITYTERTSDGYLRHPVYHGLREDKPAKEVSLDHAEPAGSDRAPEEEQDDMIEGVRLTHPDRVLYPQQGTTKAGLARYLAEVAPRMLPLVAGRPLTLLRCPSGRGKACFVQRHHAEGMPKDLKPTKIRGSDGEMQVYLSLDDAAGLVSVAQFGGLELHVWGAHRDSVECPERLVFDLDPDEGLDFGDVRSAAREIRDLLSAGGLESFPLLTGGKGIHVIAPIVPERTWSDVEAFARGLARALALASPDRYVAKASKAARKGRIFIDWLRNQRSSTAIAPYSPRAREGAPVATPVGWAELSRIDSAAAYTVESLPRRLARLKAEPWQGYHDLAQTIGDDTLDLFRDIEADGTSSNRRKQMAKNHGKQIKSDKQYEELRDKGMSKEKAARIANAQANASRKPSRKGGKKPPYEEWTKDDLLERARQIGIEGRSKMNKGELIGALRSH